MSPSGVYKLAEKARAPVSVKACKQGNDLFRYLALFFPSLESNANCNTID